jgi:hypothetical protein
MRSARAGAVLSDLDHGSQGSRDPALIAQTAVARSY